MSDILTFRKKDIFRARERLAEILLTLQRCDMNELVKDNLTQHFHMVQRLLNKGRDYGDK